MSADVEALHPNGAPFSRPIFDPINWDGVPIPPREWIVTGLIPCRAVTLLQGDGGLGKSTLALQLAIASATGQNWLAQETKPVKVLIVACEDEPEELQRRMYDILVNTGQNFGDLENIRIIPGVGFNNLLMEFEEYHASGAKTDFFHFIEKEMHDFGAQLLILDSLHDLFGGNENIRPQVRLFINMIRRIALDLNGAVLLLAHPSQAGLRDGSGNSGSTAWNNTVRSRLYLTKPADPEDRGLILKTMKSNYGPRDGEIRLTYHAGVFNAVINPNDVDDPIAMQVVVDKVFLECLDAIHYQGRYVTDKKNTSNYAPRVFAGTSINAGYGISREKFAKAMERLFADRRIKVAIVKDAHRHKKEMIVKVTDEERNMGQFSGIDPT